MNTLSRKSRTTNKSKTWWVVCGYIALILYIIPVTDFAFARDNKVPSSGAVRLTDQESAWLKAHPEKLTLFFNTEFPPIEFISGSGSFTGMGADVISRIESFLGIDFVKIPLDDLAGRRSADLTKQLLAFARKQIIEPKLLDLNQTVEKMLSMLRRLIGEDIDLSWVPARKLWPVKMDSTQVDQILANLCVNARDAIAGVGKLTIETGMKTFDPAYCTDHPGFIPGDFVMLAVSDNGCGMDQEILENLFEPFFTTKDIGKGTGLGLATIYGIVKQNNGFINVYSEPGQGSTFKIYLPRQHASAEEATAATDSERSIPIGNETILLVEDEPEILEMTRTMLEQKGYSVLSAASPAVAIQIARDRTDRTDLLITDVIMPEMNGRDLAEQVKDLFPEIKLLFMSGYTANVIVHQGMLDDGVAFLQKPFSINDLAEKVRAVLDLSPSLSCGHTQQFPDEHLTNKNHDRYTDVRLPTTDG